MDKEDVLIQEIISSLNSDFKLENTVHLKNVYHFGKFKDILEAITNAVSQEDTILNLLLYHFDKLNNDYENFLTSSEQKKHNQNLINNSDKFHKEHKNDSDDSSYKKIFRNLYSLYDSNDRDWLTQIVNLKLILNEMNRKQDKNRCLLCQSQLHSIEIEKDHFLPRSIFPTLSISRQNFTPICKTCNGKSHKGDRVPNLPIIIPNKCKTSPVEEYFQFKLLRKGAVEFDVLKAELGQLGLEIKDEQEFLSDVLPIEGLNLEQKIQVNNLIELFILKKRFNTDDFYDEISTDVKMLKDEIVENIDSVREESVEGLLDKELNKILRSFRKQDTDKIHRKFRREMLKQYIENVKEVLILEILNELKKVNNEEQL